MISEQGLIKKSLPTTKGYTLVTRIFDHGVWFQCYTSLAIMNLRQEILGSTLSFQSASYQEMMQAIRAWASAYGQDFVVLATMQVDDYFKSLKPYTARSSIDDIMPPMPTSSGSGTGGGIN